MSRCSAVSSNFISLCPLVEENACQQSGMTEGGLAVGLNPAMKQSPGPWWVSECERIMVQGQALRAAVRVPRSAGEGECVARNRHLYPALVPLLRARGCPAAQQGGRFSRDRRAAWHARAGGVDQARRRTD